MMRRSDPGIRMTIAGVKLPIAGAAPNDSPALSASPRFGKEIVPFVTHAEFLDYAILGATTCLIAIVFFHPYYFGDELLAHAFSRQGSGSFLDVLRRFDEYKPRIVFNSLWSWIAVAGLPRSMPAAVTACGFALAAMLAHRLAFRHLHSGRTFALLAGLTVVTSRFGIPSYSDYLSGTIEALALVNFLGLLAVFCPAIEDVRYRTIGRCCLWLLLSVTIVFVHERYVAALLALNGYALLLSLQQYRAQPDYRFVFTAAASAFLPLALYAAATHFLAILPLSTGTAGMQVGLSFATLKVCATFAANVFLAANFGHPWLVGSVGWPGGSLAYLTGAAGAVLAGLWLLPVAIRTHRNPAWRKAIPLALAAAALCAIASLPGPDRQEGRWMIPVCVLALLIAAAMSCARLRIAIVSLLLAANAIYFAAGSQDSVYNMVASRTARDLASSLNTLVPGNRGMVVKVPEPDYAWIIGGNAFTTNSGASGDTFCALNIRTGTCVDPPVQSNRDKIAEYDYGLARTSDALGIATYEVISKEAMQQAVSPDSIALEDVEMLGDRKSWHQWQWSSKPRDLSGNALLILPGTVGTLGVDASRLEKAILVYRAKAATAPSPMRLQVNWAGRNDVFLGTSIVVVQLGPQPRNYTMLLRPPRDAIRGHVYANMQEGATSGAELEFIGLAR